MTACMVGRGSTACLEAAGMRNSGAGPGLTDSWCRPGTKSMDLNGTEDAQITFVDGSALQIGGPPLITIACYSAAISSEPGNTTGCRRGGIAGRWTKPVAATQFVASRRKPICCGGGDLGNCISA